ncbi:unnamed protein product [Brugia timori]|uniref:Uncharacterized protein n=1 Tax=Brugia timori TaxID=42155 RepID=A0A0R3QBP4_9BILA|nr:unnamed protein product [Brugia timori]
MTPQPPPLRRSSRTVKKRPCAIADECRQSRGADTRTRANTGDGEIPYRGTLRRQPIAKRLACAIADKCRDSGGDARTHAHAGDGEIPYRTDVIGWYTLVAYTSQCIYITAFVASSAHFEAEREDDERRTEKESHRPSSRIRKPSSSRPATRTSVSHPRVPAAGPRSYTGPRLARLRYPDSRRPATGDLRLLNREPFGELFDELKV